jgi:copper chaperone CopZ
MTCAHCEARVSKAARPFAVVTSASASFARVICSKWVYDPAVTDESTLDAAVTEAVNAAGYNLLGTAKERQPVAKVIPVALHSDCAVSCAALTAASISLATTEDRQHDFAFRLFVTACSPACTA